MTTSKPHRGNGLRARGLRLSARMKYFYDHQTDAVSFILADFRDYSDAEEIVPGVILYLQGGKVVAIDIRDATKVLDTRGLVPLYARSITPEEIKRRMAITDAGQSAWRAVQGRI